MELLLDIFLDAQLAHALCVAGSRAEREAIEDVRDALILSHLPSLRPDARLRSRERRETDDERQSDDGRDRTASRDARRTEPNVNKIFHADTAFKEDCFSYATQDAPALVLTPFVVSLDARRRALVEKVAA
jgi:hypothetical protein